MKPAVSVIMAAYNNRSTIIEAVDSVLAQTSPCWELIIIDDHSRDGTGSLVSQRYNDARIRVHRMNKNVGAGQCRNFGMQLARGEFIAILDADDRSLPNRHELQLRAFESHPNAAAVSGHMLEFGSWGGPVLNRMSTDPTAIRRRQINGRMPIAHGASMFRRDVLLCAGGYDEGCRRAEDYGLFLRLFDKQLISLDAPLIEYRTVRPISFGYVLRETANANLALTRFEQRRAGVSEDMLPTTAKLSLRVLGLGTKNWVLRTINDYQNVSKSKF
ncbi:glycosyltransferase family 2 protein [Kocuria rosea]|uniref:glycosyltransferase family 2 protein n=1 Tax=Kocuria rosea TaxID=1275 RepID=UPI0025B762F9|nr:glycosyltransferase [Kocuria rosea]WJZ65521.1 glycosyltransferase [Kocuria rosea]